MNPEAPTAAELEQNPVVQAALAAAWSDSLPDDPNRRHEEGGWIYQSLTSGEIMIRRANAGIDTAIDLSGPPHVEGAVVVGVFHTHPNPAAEGWEPGPSSADGRADERDGIPDLIQADNGVYHSGPSLRRGGLGGNPGFPD